MRPSLASEIVTGITSTNDDAGLPSLTFPSNKYGDGETPWNLKILLYKGGASANSRLFGELAEKGLFGDLQRERLPLVVKLHEAIYDAYDGGGSRATAETQIVHLRLFFGWADRQGYSLTIEQVMKIYCAWADSLIHRTRAMVGQNNQVECDRRLTMRSAYIYGATVGTLLDRAIDRHTRAIEVTRLYMPSHRKTASGPEAEKQNLENTFSFGHLLQDVCDQLTIEVIRDAPLPILLKLRDGKTFARGGGKAAHAAKMHGTALAERYSLANLRIEAELMLFIGQTSMNLAQAQNLKLRHFFYVSHLDGFQVKDYKARRGGVVLFEIFQDYRPHFERYLAWRTEFFPQSSLLFPYIRTKGARADRRCGAHRLRKICSELKMVFVGPQSLRNTRVNWMLRKTADPDLTAEMAQHAKETLHRVYERPSQQRAMVEVTLFWASHESRSLRTQAVAPGGCTGNPKAVPAAPRKAPKPDCLKPSGCLWCENHRDIDSMDHVWALASFKRLKALELSKMNTPPRDHDIPPAQFVVDRLNVKLRWFQNSNSKRRDWVAEAEARIDEGNYHPHWHEVITVQEGNL